MFLIGSRAYSSPVSQEPRLLERQQVCIPSLHYFTFEFLDSKCVLGFTVTLQVKGVLVVLLNVHVENFLGVDQPMFHLLRTFV